MQEVRLLFVGTLLTLLSSAVQAEQVTLSQKQIAWIKTDIGEKMKDPDSVKFKNLKAAKHKNGTGWIDVCGKFNAKNSYGAYTGYRLFHGWITETGFIPVSYGQSESHDLVAYDTCIAADLI